jgi:hypothetical protein
MSRIKKTRLRLGRETLVELRPQALAAIHGGAGDRFPTANGVSCTFVCCTQSPRGE